MGSTAECPAGSWGPWDSQVTGDSPLGPGSGPLHVDTCASVERSLWMKAIFTALYVAHSRVQNAFGGKLFRVSMFIIVFKIIVNYYYSIFSPSGSGHCFMGEGTFVQGTLASRQLVAPGALRGGRWHSCDATLRQPLGTGWAHRCCGPRRGSVSAVFPGRVSQRLTWCVDIPSLGRCFPPVLDAPSVLLFSSVRKWRFETLPLSYV